MQKMELTKVGAVAGFLFILGALGLMGLLFSLPELLEAQSAAEFLPAMTADALLVGITGWLLIALPLLLATFALAAFKATAPSGAATAGATALIAGAAILVLRGALWLAINYELAPAYMATADPAAQTAIAATADAFEAIAFYAADLTVGAILVTVGVLGLTMAARAKGMVGRGVMIYTTIWAVLNAPSTLLQRYSEVLELLSFLAYVMFWAWLIIVGRALWRVQPEGVVIPASQSRQRTGRSGAD